MRQYLEQMLFHWFRKPLVTAIDRIAVSRQRCCRASRGAVQYPWSDTDGEYQRALIRGTLRELEHYTWPTKGYRRSRLFLGPCGDPNFWPAACLCLALARVNGGSEAGDAARAVRAYLSTVFDEEGVPRRPIVCLDQCMVAQVILADPSLWSDHRFGGASRHLVDYLVNTHVRTPGGTLPYRQSAPNLVLVDSLAMVCPLLICASVALDLPQALDLACHQLDEFLEQGVNPKNGLPFHGFEIGGDDSLGLCGWGRGTGWYLFGLVETLAGAPHLMSSKPGYGDAISSCASTLERRQCEDGSWSWAVTIPGAQRDSSATSIIAYSLARAIDLRLLPSTYMQVVRRAVQAIVGVTLSDGLVDKSSAECLGLGLYPSVFTPTTWAQAWSLLLVLKWTEWQSAGLRIGSPR